ncbi:hypothetical protein Q1695_008871 [Nippostrongylus brasiliensis]|nr:hypothetical protein Q1695_008871 [Nippostrongylus brasiliensis]
MSSENTQTYAPQPPHDQFHRLKKERDMLIEERWDCEKVKKERRVECKQIVDKVKGRYDRMKQMREDITKRIGVLNEKVRTLTVGRKRSEIEAGSALLLFYDSVKAQVLSDYISDGFDRRKQQFARRCAEWDCRRSLLMEHTLLSQKRLKDARFI